MDFFEVCMVNDNKLNTGSVQKGMLCFDLDRSCGTDGYENLQELYLSQ